ncbi:MAG TPA: hypothetical protein V6D21_19475, partial [Candidatus Obscuribacterales bacterium]
EQRSLLRKRFAHRGVPSLSLSLNVPGYPKSNAIVRAFFRYCLSDLQYYLNANQIFLCLILPLELSDAEFDSICSSSGGVLIIGETSKSRISKPTSVGKTKSTAFNNSCFILSVNLDIRSTGTKKRTVAMCEFHRMPEKEPDEKNSQLEFVSKAAISSLFVA